MFFKRLKEIDDRWKSYAIAGCICVLFFACITHLGGILGGIAGFLDLFRPVLIGAVIAYIVHPMARFFDRTVLRRIRHTKLRWSLSVVLTLIVDIALLSVLMASLLPQLAASLQSLLDNIGVYIDNLIVYSESLPSPVKEIVRQLTEFVSGAEDPIASIAELMTNNLNSIIATTSNIGSRAINAGIGAIIAIYLLLAKSPISDAFRQLMSLLMTPSTYQRSAILVNEFNAIFSKYITCELWDALIIGGANFLFMTLLKMPDALVISVLVGVTNLAPTFGPIVGGAIGGFILLLVSPGSVIPFLVFTVILQSFDAYLIKPKLFGGALNVPGVLILIAIIVFGRLWGVAGMLIAIPAAAIIVYFYSQMLIPWLEQRKRVNTAGKSK